MSIPKILNKSLAAELSKMQRGAVAQGFKPTIRALGPQAALFQWAGAFGPTQCVKVQGGDDAPVQIVGEA